MVLRFSQWFRDLLTSRGWDQAAAAQFFDTSQSQISGWLSGRAVPSLRTLERMAVSLGRTSEDLLAEIYGRTWDGKLPVPLDLAVAQIQLLDPQEQIVICARLIVQATDALSEDLQKIKKPNRDDLA